MRKCVVFGGIAAALAFAPVGAVCGAGDYEAPSGIELSIGDIDIDRADLSGDRILEVPVYIGNNSGFVSVEMLIELDGRLRFDEDIELGTRAEEMSGVHIMHYMDMDNKVTAKFTTKKYSRFTDDGEIGYLRVVVPEDTPQGRYDIWLSSSPDEGHMLLTHNSYDAWFGSQCFSQLTGGSITVRDKNAEAQPEQAAPQHEDNGQRNEETQSSSSDNNDNGREAALTTAVTTAATTAKTTKTTKKTTAAASSAITDTEKGTSAVTSAASETTVTSAEAEVGKTNKDHKVKDLLIPVIIATVIALGTACFIVRKRR